MKFKYHKNDPIDQVPAPPVKMAVSLAAIVALFLAILYSCGAVLGG